MQGQHLAAWATVVSLALVTAACSPGTTGPGGATGAAGGASAGTGGTVGAAGTSGGTSGLGGQSSGAAGASGGAGASGAAGSSSAAGVAGPGSAGTSGGSYGISGQSGGAAGSGGGGGTAGSAGASGRGGGAGTVGGAGSGAGGAPTRFSFFVTSIEAMRELSGSQDGFGGDLRFGETGEGAGLRGADKICTAVAERSLPGSGAKSWRAFLSTVAGPVHAKDRVGNGPWYDRMGRLVASNLTQLLMDRPGDADSAIKNDLPNEYGIPNQMAAAPGCAGSSCANDNHDTLTGTGKNGMLYTASAMYTCDDWTSSAMSGRPWCGHSWPGTASGTNWMSALAEGGCAPGVNLTHGGGPMTGVYTVGTGGGYGAIYCFALAP